MRFDGRRQVAEARCGQVGDARIAHAVSRETLRGEAVAGGTTAGSAGQAI